MTHVYLSGPMTGHPNYNYQAFDEAAAQLRALGHQVFNPTEQFDRDQSLPFSVYLRHDIDALQTVDAVVVLDGWEASAGAWLEVMIATAIGASTITLTEALAWNVGDPIPQLWEPGRKALQHLLDRVRPDMADRSPLEEAGELVNGARQSDYGHPLDDFSKTAMIWTALLSGKLQPGVEIEAEDVPLCMVGVKLSREVNRRKRDNIVDGQGYFETYFMALQERRRRSQEQHPSRRY